MKRFFLHACMIGVLLGYLSACQSKQKVDLIIHNATIYTVNDLFPKAEAFAIQNGKFVAVGKNQDILNQFEAAKTINLEEKPVFPGFIDAHCHFYGLGKSLQEVDLNTASSMRNLVEIMVDFQKKFPDKKWITGRGWDQNKWENKEMPDNALLNQVFPNTPIFVKRVDGHAAVANQKALELAGITLQSKVSGGEIGIKNGKLTGLLVDNAMELVEKIIPDPNLQDKKMMLIAAQEVCFANGITTVDDAGLPKETIDIIDEMQKANLLKMRIYAMLDPSPSNKDYYLKHGIYKTDKLNVCSFKVYADGALGSRGAFLIEPYSDKLESKGFLLSDTATMRQLFADIYKSGFQVNTHCIGDGANRIVTDLYAEILKEKNDRRWRIEHAQVVHQNDISKYGKYSIIPSVQPVHCTSDMLWADERLGAERIKSAYIYKDLMLQNQKIAFGTDFPIESPNPIHTFHAAVFRQNAEHQPEKGFQMENALSREETLKAMTIWAAFSNFEEKEKGSIEVGKVADFVVLDTDLMTTDARLMRNTQVLKTYLNGECVYDKSTQ